MLIPKLPKSLKIEKTFTDSETGETFPLLMNYDFHYEVEMAEDFISRNETYGSKLYAGKSYRINGFNRAGTAFEVGDFYSGITEMVGLEKVKKVKVMRTMIPHTANHYPQAVEVTSVSSK